MSILKQLALIPDPRKDINIKHQLIDVIFLVFAAVLSGAWGWKSIQDFGEAQLVGRLPWPPNGNFKG